MELDETEKAEMVADVKAAVDAAEERGLAAKAIRKLGTIKLQGKEYLQVAHRILLFRQDHPEASIQTQYETVGTAENAPIVATCVIADAQGRRLAQAHKSVQAGGKGPAGKYPLEMAETGAIGRALGLCGYGTLGGDLDEGDQIADAPQSTTRKW